jgi:hypothetical protein
VGTVQGELDGRFEGTKALDFIGVRHRELWLIEIKDFRNRPIQYKVRSSELPLEIALKVRDTLAGLVGRHRQDAAEPWIPRAVALLVDTTATVTVVAAIARPGAWRTLPEHKRKTLENVLMKKTRQRLAWLTRRVFVLDPSEIGVRIPDLTVSPSGQR